MSTPIEARILVIDADAALLGLLEEWLEGRGCRVVAADECDDAPQGRYDLIVIDVPFPRRGLEHLKRVAERHPGTPIVALSSNFFAGAGAALAKALGVARVLPKPVTEEALVRAAEALLESAA